MTHVKQTGTVCGQPADVGITEGKFIPGTLKLMVSISTPETILGVAQKEIAMAVNERAIERAARRGMNYTLIVDFKAWGDGSNSFHFDGKKTVT